MLPRGGGAEYRGASELPSAASEESAPPELPLPFGVPRNWTFSVTILSLLRFCPLCLSSHWSSFSRPWTSAGAPFVIGDENAQHLALQGTERRARRIRDPVQLLAPIEPDAVEHAA